MKKLNQQGYNLVELVIAVALLAILASSVMVARSYMAKQTVSATDKAYASQKAIQMFEELRALVNGTEKLGISVLDNYSDGTSYNTVLTTDQLVDTRQPTANPYDPLSGNKNSNGHARYLRQIQINHVPNDIWARQVVVKVWLFDSDKNPNQPGLLLSTVGGYLRTIASVEAPYQVLDVYCLGLSNVLGWFTTIPSMVPTFKRIAVDIQDRNPGLQLRLHYITQTGYGRDPYYRPSINLSQATTSVAALPFVYLYPGLSPQDNSASPANSNAMFFDDGQLQAAGNILVDYNARDNTYKTSMCDMYNADMRYPDALAQYAAITTTAAASIFANGNAVDPSQLPARTLRILLEQMNTSTDLKNALMLSMHGEVLPMPNMRNYSDPAKDPAIDPLAGGVYNPLSNRYRRVVTHPQLLHSASTKAVTLRVYNYYDGLIDPSALETSMATSVGNVASTISLYFPNLKMSSNSIGVTAIVGGISNSGVTTAYSSVSIGAGVTNYGMSMTITNPNANDTLLTLYNTPMRCPEVVVGGVTTGLSENYQLYSTEYIPCPVDTNKDYRTDLTAHPVTGARNTARWIIGLKGTTASPAGGITTGQYSVETRYGTDLTTGTATGAADQMSNLSRTYFWVGGNGSSTIVGTSGCGIVPWTERFQFNGDPRDCPYLDAKFGTSAIDATDTLGAIDADSYNWYFRAFNGTNGYSGFTQATSGYDIEDMRDIPRYYYTYRHGLLNNTAIFGNLNGYSFWHASEGGEIGSTYNPWVNSLQFDKKPWDPAGASAAVSIDEIQSSNNYTAPSGAGIARGIMKYDLVAGSTSPYTNWYARTWEGEMYPDDWFPNSWMTSGNLPTGTTGFWRVPFRDMNTGVAQNLDGFDTGRDFQWGVGGKAPAAFMNGWDSSGTNHGFMHDFNGNADTTTLADSDYYITNYPMQSPLVGSRPWSWTDDLTGNLPLEWNSTYYSSEANGRRTILSMPAIGGTNRIFYENDSAAGGPTSPDAHWHTVGVVKMSINNPTAQACYFSFSGLAPQGTFDTSALGKITMAMLLRSFLDGGQYAGSGHIAQLPMVKLYVNSPYSQYPYPTSSSYTVGITLTSPVTTSSASVSTSQAITNIWYRYPGISSYSANFYTDEYPGYTATAPLTLSTYTESDAVSLWVNFKWSTDEKFWYFLSDNAPATVGVYDATAGHGVTYASNAPMITNWDVSDAVTFPQGNYWIRGEAYRPDHPLHYSYHDFNITINR